MTIVTNQKQVNAIIPDNSDKGLVDSIRVFQKGEVQGAKVKVNIDHSFNGDLEIYLESPSGESVKLHERTGRSGKNVNATYEGEALAAFNGTKSQGVWKLTVKDYAPRDQGTLQNWSIQLHCGKAKGSEIFIPDGEGKELVSKQLCELAGDITEIAANVDIEHGFIGDLEVSLTGPSGTTVVLHDSAGGSKKNLVKDFSKKVLKPFIGEKAKGVWTLTAKDFAPRDAGRIRKWGVDLKLK